MLDPQSLIREGVDTEHTVPIKLSDGNTWLLPKPFLSLNPIFRDGKAVRPWTWLSYGPELDGLVRAISEAGDVVDQILAAMTLGAYLIRRIYDLDDRQLESLFQYRGGDPDSEAMIRIIIETATGTGGKKACAVG